MLCYGQSDFVLDKSYDVGAKAVHYSSFASYGATVIQNYSS